MADKFKEFQKRYKTGKVKMLANPPPIPGPGGIARTVAGQAASAARRYAVSGAQSRTRVTQPKPGSKKFIGPTRPAQPGDKNFIGPMNRPQPGQSSFIGPTRPTVSAPSGPRTRTVTKRTAARTAAGGLILGAAVGTGVGLYSAGGKTSAPAKVVGGARPDRTGPGYPAAKAKAGGARPEMPGSYPKATSKGSSFAAKNAEANKKLGKKASGKPTTNNAPVQQKQPEKKKGIFGKFKLSARGKRPLTRYQRNN